MAGFVHFDRPGHPAVQSFRQILNSATDYAIIAFDTQGRVTQWNEGAVRILGWTEEEMLGQDGSRFFTPEDRETGRMQAEMRAALASGSGNDERWHVRKSGERFWANGEMTPLRDDDDSVIGFVKVLRDRTEQHRIAEALRQSERRLHRAQEAGGVGTFAVDIASDRVFGTRQFYRIFGVPESESLPATIFEALVVRQDADLRSDAARRETESAALDVEYRIRRADDGALRWIARKAEFEHDATGRPTRLVGVVQDITEKRATLDALEASAQQFRTLAEALPSHVWTARADGLLDWLNDRVYEYTGAARGAFDGAAWPDAVHHDDLPQALAGWRASVATGENFEAEYRIRRADGAYRWHLVRARPLRSADGAVVRWLGTSTDIHERKLDQVETARSRDRIWTLSQELMLICDFDGIICAVNPSATRLLGWAGDLMVGRGLSDFLHPDDLRSTADEVARLSEGVTTLAFENRYRARDGSYRLISWTAVPDGGYIHAVGRDVSRERATEDALRQAQKMEAIGQLTGGVAHDFNNVLAVIKTSIDLLRRVQLTDERRQRFMDSISNAVDRATRLTGQLLAFARRQALQPEVFDAGQNARSVSEMIGSLTGARIETVLDLADESCFVDADPSQFDTALVNLSVNARDAMAQSGRLTITVRSVDEIPGLEGEAARPGEYVAVAVADTGSGIAPQNLTQIFEPFFTTKGVGHGTGLGLSQVFGFAKQSGGDIRVQSTLGQGSTFTLYLPRAARPVRSRKAGPDELPLARGSGGRILVVEDNPDLAESVRQTLEELGYRTHMTGSAEQALAELQHDAGRFVAVFTDVVMAGMSGIDLGHEIRRKYPGLPVVLSSGYSYVLAQNANLSFPLLQKPYAVDMLARELHDAVHASATGHRRRRSLHDLPREEPSAEAARAAEEARLAALASLGIMDTVPDATYDEMTALAAKFCNTPIALISLVDGTRQWFKAKYGLQADETPREQAFCDFAIREPDRLMVVGDASCDTRFVDNPLVTGEPGIRFYAGAPLVTASGHALGTLCVIDRVPRELDARQREMLQFLAQRIVERMQGDTGPG